MKRFWKPKQPREETLAMAVARLKRVEHLVLKNQKDLMAKIKQCEIEAKKNFKTYPQIARAHIQKKQRFLQQHKNITKQLETVQQQLSGLELNLVTTEVRLFCATA